MKSAKVGIGDLRLYVPRKELRLELLVEGRLGESPDLAKHLDRALKTTGQRSIRFPAPREDSATMAAEAAYELLAANPGRSMAALRYFVAGTETGLDQAKPLSSYVLGMLQRAGLPLRSNLASFQVQHACAGATLGLVSVAAMIATAGRGEDTGMVLASDISRYRVGTTAEITHGAGAAALLVENDPRLLELDLESVGYCSHDVDDFFRPLGSVTAQVKGGYSMDCYLQALAEAFTDHCERLGRTAAQVLAETDMVALHAPFRNMPEIAMKRLLKIHLGLSEEEGTSWLAERGFYDGVDIIADIGNAYSASIFIFLANTLKTRRAALGDRIAGKRVLIASYGSGNIMTVLSARVAEAAPSIIDGWDLRRIMAAGVPATMEDYDRWTRGYEPEVAGGINEADSGSFLLAGIRGDGYREYEHARCHDHPRAEAGAAGDLHRSLAVPC